MENCLSRAKDNLKAKQAVVSEYESEVLKVILGESKLDADLLNKLHTGAKTEADEARREMDIINSKWINNHRESLTDVSERYDGLLR